LKERGAKSFEQMHFFENSGENGEENEESAVRVPRGRSQGRVIVEVVTINAKSGDGRTQ